MSDSDSTALENTPTPYGRYDYSGDVRSWIPDDLTQALKGRTATAFDPSQVAYSANANYQGMPTEYYDKSGNMIGYWGRDDAPVSTSGYNFVDNAGNPMVGALDKRSYYQQTDNDGNLLFVNPDYSEGSGASQYTIRDTGIPAYGQLAQNIKMNAPSPGILQDPLFRNFLISAATMGGAAALAPAAGAAAGGAEAFPVVLGDSITMSPLAGGIAEAGASGLAGLTGADLLKYGKAGLSGLSALSSIAGAAGKLAGGNLGGGGTGQPGLSLGGGGGGQTNVYNSSGPWNTPLTPGVMTVGQSSQRPITSGLENLEMLEPQVETPQQSFFTYGTPVATAYPVQEYKNGGGVLRQFKGGGHVPEFITGTTGHYVKGRGDGQSDDIPAMLAEGEYVFDSATVSDLGNGSSDAGAKILDKMREELRRHKRSAPVDEIPPKAKSPLEYIKHGMKRK